MESGEPIGAKDEIGDVTQVSTQKLENRGYITRCMLLDEGGGDTRSESRSQR